MTINNDVRYAVEKIHAAHDLLASLTIPSEKRLAGAVHEILLAAHHKPLPTARARELHEIIMRPFEGRDSWEELAARLSELELHDISEAICSLSHEVTAAYYGEADE